MSRALRAAVLFAALFLNACSSSPPPSWATGGTRIALGDATWRLSDEDVTMGKDGRVHVGSSTAFSLDVAGRVYDEDGDPGAILLSNGQVVGPDEVYLGRVGITNASPPGQETAWLSLSPAGDVVLFDIDGERRSAGKWYGCSGPLLRTCTLVTHLLVLQRAAAAQHSSGVYMGVGVGVYR